MKLPKFNIINKKDGRIFYKSDNIEIVEKTDKSCYISILGNKTTDLGGLGYTRDCIIKDFDNIKDAKNYIKTI